MRTTIPSLAVNPTLPNCAVTERTAEDNFPVQENSQKADRLLSARS
jgi:hypothetical protein